MHRLLLLALVACGSRAPVPPSAAPVEKATAVATSEPRPASVIDVWLGQMGSNTTAGDALAPVLRDAVAEAFRADAQFALDGRGTSGFHVDGVLTVSVKRTGRASRITCKVDMLIGSYPSRAIFGLPSSSAEVGATSVASDIDAGRRDCIRAVATELVARHVIPMLRKRSVEQRDMMRP